MPGAVSVTLEREPEYFRGENLAGGEDRTIVAFAGEQLVCMGRCSFRDCWVNGGPRRTGYLAELRLDSDARGRFGILRDGYRFFDEVQAGDPAKLYFTSIAADNDRARRLFESGARGLPTYCPLGELETLLIPVPHRPGNTNLRVETGSTESIPALLRLLNTPRHQLAAVWTKERLHALENHGLPLSRFLLAFDGGEAIACGALWDQRHFRQIVIRGYSPALAISRPLINFANRILGSPRLPPAGSTLSQAFLSPLAFAEGAEMALPDFVAAFFPSASAQGLEFLALALPTMDPRLPTLRRRFSARTWRSRLYRVDLRERDSIKIVGGPFLPDIALL